MNEIWKDVEGYEGLYQVSNLGRIRSLDHDVIHISHYKGSILKPDTSDRYPYPNLTLCKPNPRRTIRKNLHRLIAETFIPNPLRKPYVNHIDGNKANNRIENLEWTTPSENQQHAFRIGLRQVGEKVKNAKLTDNIVREIRVSPLGKYKLAKKFSVSPTVIHRIRNGQGWRHVL